MPAFEPTPLGVTEGLFTAYRAVRKVHLGQVHGRGRDIQKDQIVLFDGTTVEIIPAGYTHWRGTAGYGERFYHPGFITAIEVGLFEEEPTFPTGLEIQEDGVALSRKIDSLNFSGSGISLEVDTTDDRKVNLDITGGLSGGSQVSSGVGAFTCPNTVDVGDLVYVSGSDQVDLADVTDYLKMPAVGIVIGKPTLTSATVAYFGEVDVFAGLTPGAAYYVGPLGSVVDAHASPRDFGTSVQRIGIALSTTTMLVVMNDFLLL